eukprot:1016013-Pyramimonas_sp.AAC.1
MIKASMRSLICWRLSSSMQIGPASSPRWPSFPRQMEAFDQSPLAAVIRVHGRLRRPIMQQWEKASDRPHWWACSGRSRDRAAWQQLTRSEWIAMMAELHPDQDWASASILLGRWKAPEQ